MSNNGARIAAGAVIAVVLAIGLGAGAMYLVPSTSTNSSISSISRGSTQSSSQSTVSGILGSTGVLNIYLTDAPPTKPLFDYLLLNVSSVVLMYTGNVSANVKSHEWTYNVPSASGTDVNLTKLVNNKILLGATEVPTGNISEIILSVNGARAFFNDGSSSMLKIVADGKLMIPIQFIVNASGTSDLTLDITPNSIHLSHGNTPVLTPVVHVTVVQKWRSSTDTMTASADPGGNLISTNSTNSTAIASLTATDT